MRETIKEKEVRLIRRAANMAADWVATQSKEGMCPTGWLGQPPSSLVLVLSRDGVPAPPDSV